MRHANRWWTNEIVTGKTMKADCPSKLFVWLNQIKSWFTTVVCRSGFYWLGFNKFTEWKIEVTIVPLAEKVMS